MEEMRKEEREEETAMFESELVSEAMEEKARDERKVEEVMEVEVGLKRF